MNLNYIGLAVPIEVADEDGVVVWKGRKRGRLKRAVAIAQRNGDGVNGVTTHRVVNQADDVAFPIAVHIRLKGLLLRGAACGDLSSADEAGSGCRGPIFRYRLGVREMGMALPGSVRRFLHASHGPTQVVAGGCDLMLGLMRKVELA